MTTLELFPPQKEVINQGLLSDRSHCLLNMSTGSGKTYLSELAIEETIRKGYKAVYITPLKALAEEKYAQWQVRFKGFNIGVFTGDTLAKNMKQGNYQASDILIMTPERLDACLRNWNAHWHWIPDIDLLVLDEFHLINDAQRGPRLEGSITRILRINPFVKIIALSATMPNVESLAEWLNGEYYKSKWRLMPLGKRIIRFSSPKEKLPLLSSVVSECVTNGGQSLVFVNSRSRASAIAEHLASEGFISVCHHAGISHEIRKKIEESYRAGTTQVLVTTSTLEMGLNLPARQVVIYDSYSFNGTGFIQLPVWSYIQRSGRAGRPGLDTSGEVVMLLPKWAGEVDKYVNEECEPIRSQLGNARMLSEQILIELTSRFSRNQQDLEEGFLPLTLFKHQHSEANIKSTLHTLLSSGMLISREEDDKKGNAVQTLKPSYLGRLAVRLMFSPSTVKLIQDIYTSMSCLYFFDLLLMSTLVDDCTPVLRTNYEDLDSLMDIVNDLPSYLMDLSLEKFKGLSTEMPSTLRFLSCIKMAALCYAITEGSSKETLCETFDLYESDLEMLKESVVRILGGISVIITTYEKVQGSAEESDDMEKTVPPRHPSKLCLRLSDMLRYEIDSIGVNITRLSGVGGKTAKMLIENGYDTIETIAHEAPDKLSQLPGIGLTLAKKILTNASELSNSGSTEDYYEEKEFHKITLFDLKTAICPYRLRRSLELRVRGHEGKYYLVTGGREDHRVVKQMDTYTCDCMDYEKHKKDCKHILCVKRVLMDKTVCNSIKRVKEDANQSLRHSIPSLWFSISIPD